MGAVYGVDRVDIALEMEQWAAGAAHASAALLALFYFRCDIHPIHTVQ